VLLSAILPPLQQLNMAALAAGLFLMLVGCCEVGFRAGRRMRGRPDHAGAVPNIGTVTAGMLGLLAFTLGLSISIAQGRFDGRRGLVVQEANAIGTAWLRAGLVAGEEGPEIRRLLAEYTQLRLDYTTAAPDPARIEALNVRTGALQTALWQQMTELAQRLPNPITGHLAAALNEVFDMALAQRFAYESRVPSEILWMLLTGSVLAIGALGYQLGLGGHRFPLLSTLLVLMWVGGMLLIIDLSRPREGHIKPDARPLIWTLQGFGTP
jgi:hypothetical protein